MNVSILDRSIEDKLIAFAKETILLIQTAIRTRPVYKGNPANASGKTAASLRYEIQGETLIIFGAGHIFALEFGRKPSASKGTGESLRERIRHWIDEKGIQPDGISKDSLAFLIARKIHQEGTLLYRTKQRTGTLTDAINKDRIDKLVLGLKDVFVPFAVSTLLEGIKDN